MYLSYKKLQKETLCDIQLSSIIFLVEQITVLLLFKKIQTFPPYSNPF